MKTLITRKEIAQLTSLCVKTIRVKERHFGLDKARVDTGSDRVFYNREKVMAALRARNLAN